MTTTDTLQHVGGSTESVTMQVAEKSTTLILISSDSDPKTGRNTSTYSISGADAAHPSVLVVSVDPPGPDTKTRYVGFKYQTWLKRTSDVDDTISWWAVQSTNSFVIAGDAPIVVADLLKLAEASFSYLYASVSSGAPATTVLAAALAGSPLIK